MQARQPAWIPAVPTGVLNATYLLAIRNPPRLTAPRHIPTVAPAQAIFVFPTAMTNLTLFLRAIILAILAAAPLAGLQAQSVAELTQTLDFRLNANSAVWTNPDPNGSDGETTTLSFNPFDSSLGTLQYVSLNFTGTERYVLGAYQTGGSTMNHHSLQIDNTGVFMIGNQSIQLPATPKLTGVSPGVVSLATANSSLAAGFTTFLAGGTPTFPGGVTLAGNETLFGASSLPLDFTDLSPSTLSARARYQKLAGITMPRR
jgi:hypothetical protein